MRLLLAEDEAALSHALVAVLKRNNYSVDAVSNGEDAVDYLRTGLYDAAILDIMMPKLDGLSALKIIRAEGFNLPVLMLTAKSEIADKIAGLDGGADDYLTKPFVMQELLARVRALLRRSADASDSVLSFGNVVLNRSTYEMLVGETSMKLGHKEFQMLEMLMIKPGKMISAEKFMDKIWGYDSEATISVVWVYISYLRKKLQTLGADVCIKASRNVGYYLELVS